MSQDIPDLRSGRLLAIVVGCRGAADGPLRAAGQHISRPVPQPNPHFSALSRLTQTWRAGAARFPRSRHWRYQATSGDLAKNNG